MAPMGLKHEKNGGRKSRDTLPLSINQSSLSNFQLCPSIYGFNLQFTLQWMVVYIFQELHSSLPCLWGFELLLVSHLPVMDTRKA